MGGNALTIETNRLSVAEFEQFSKELILKIEQVFNRACVPLYYRDKESFGDIDIVVDIGPKDNCFTVKSIIGYIESTFKPSETYKNDNCISFDYKGAQVDFMWVHSEEYDIYTQYLSYNDLGNFMGRIAQTLGVKYGTKGLYYDHYIDGIKVDRIYISKEAPKIFRFLGLDHKRWEEGFDTLEDIFDYVTTSKYFHPQIFELTNLNAINRERNKKRKSYMALLDYLEDKEPHPDYDSERVEYIKRNIVTYVLRTFRESDIRDRVKILDKEYRDKKNAKKKFNGKHIIDHYGITGVELGQAMAKFEDYLAKHFPTYTYHEFILNKTNETILNVFGIANGLI